MMEYVFLGAIVAVCLTTVAVGNQIATQTGILQELLLDIKRALEKEEPTDYTIKYDANDIYRLLEDFPDKIAKEIKYELGYRTDDYMGLEYDIKGIKEHLKDIEQSIIGIEMIIPN